MVLNDFSQIVIAVQHSVCSMKPVKYRVASDPWSLKMDREWFTERLLQIDIAVLVVVVVVGITAITSRLARDPSDSVVRWWQERGRMAAPLDQQPGALLVQDATTASETAGQANESQVHAPEWLERLIGRHQPSGARPRGNVPADQEAA